MTAQSKLFLFVSVLLLAAAVPAGCAREKSSAPLMHEKKSLQLAEAEEQVASTAAAAPLRYRNEADRQTGHAEVIPFGPVFKPASSAERRLEYAVHLSYQISDLKTTRAFFNQWIPRFGFLLSESASGLNGGHLSLQVKIRSTQLYQALSELDSVGTLASEQITVADHTEAAVLRSLSAAREELRLRRRSAAVQPGGAQSKNWQSAENLLAASEDKDLQNRIEEWRINDRTAWATVNISLAMPVVAQTATIDVPHFRNAFVGVLNVLLQSLYLLIYLIPFGIVVWLGWRGFRRLHSALTGSCI